MQGEGRQTEQTSVLMGTTYFLTNSALDRWWHSLSFKNFFSPEFPLLLIEGLQNIMDSLSRVTQGCKISTETK